MFNENKISFRKLHTDDLPLLLKWLNEPFVKEWYGKDDTTTFDDISKKYTPRIFGEDHIKCFIVNYTSIPVAYIQTYTLSEYPQEIKDFGLDSKTAGLDLFIGNKDYFGIGLGSLILKKFLQEVVFITDNIDICIVDPEPSNIRAIKSYEKVGFNHLKTIHIPKESIAKYVMIIHKKDL